MTRRAKSRLALIATLGVLGVVPVATGAIGMLLGLSTGPGGAPTTPSVDSEYRFVNVFWTAAGAILWWSLGDLERRADATRLTLALASVGGLPRLLSWFRAGRPHPVFVGTIVLELVIVPLVLAWHARVVHR